MPLRKKDRFLAAAIESGHIAERAWSLDHKQRPSGQVTSEEKEGPG